MLSMRKLNFKRFSSEHFVAYFVSNIYVSDSLGFLFLKFKYVDKPSVILNHLSVSHII